MKNISTILALDFDGVLCDGLLEYFQTAWRVYCQIWSPPSLVPPEGLADRFYRLRPVVETGWEMPVLLRSLVGGISEAAILQNWSAIAHEQLVTDSLTPAEVAVRVDITRDAWIAQDLEGWLAEHRFYPGVIEKLQQVVESSVYPVIVTTKEGRFVHQLLQQQGIQLQPEQIFGKEVKRPKSQILRELIQQAQFQADPAQIWFIEDRLKTLYAVAQEADLSHVELYLADWGYNTLQERNLARHDPWIRLLSLSEFAQDFSAWP